MTRTIALAVLWVILLAKYGLLRIAVEFTFGLAVIFVGSIVPFGIYDAIRARDPKPGPTRPKARRTNDADDEELAQLRHMAGLNRREP
jgi:hypothetical protein